MAQPEPSSLPAHTSESNGLIRATEGKLPDFASGYCPRCSSRLVPQRCKLICCACGYYMSCSDYI
jgi:hypothetical protein